MTVRPTPIHLAKCLLLFKPVLLGLGSVVDADNFLDLWTIQSITDKSGKGDTIIVKVPLSEPGK